ncbi:MAG: hypothetical protein HY905_21205 [Deltaproteobacteria bacterium]|nr:hypothetical protein [Deltaproteobacteria bacterium]
MPPPRPLACPLHILALAALGGAAGAGCLVTDPVPYEPSENIPPIVIPTVVTPDPLLITKAEAGDRLTFSLAVRDLNLDDVLLARLIVNPSATDPGYRDELQIPPAADGTRDREVTFRDVAVDGLGLPCSRVIVAVSDRGFRVGSPLYLPPEDADHQPLTTVALVQWTVWIDDGTTVDGPAVGTCGVR